MATISILLQLSLPLLFLITGEFVYNINAQLVNCIVSDRKALLDFKNGLHDPESRLSSWKGRNCCQWRGVRCDDATGAVTVVDLHNPYPIGSDSSFRYGLWNLSGEIRPSLAKLKSLRYLDLSFNTFTGNPVPEIFGFVENLEYLNLSNSEFSGTIPPNLGNITGLQYLDLGNLNLFVESLEWARGLVSLKYFAMNKVDLSKVGPDWVETLNELPFLTELHLSSCSLSGFLSPHVSVNFTSLSVMDLGGNDFYSRIPDWLANISSLVYLDMSYCSLYGRIPLGLSDLPNLRHLDLSGNDNLSASCSQLFREGWKNIEVINLASNKLHGKLPSSLGNLTTLAHLDLFYNNVKGGIPSSIGKICKLNVLRISGNYLDGSLPEFLEGTENCLSNLQYVDLANNHLVGKLPDWLFKLENLVELSLDYNMLQGPIPSSWGPLQNLTQLGLAGNELNGTIPESVGQLPELSVLDVSSNHLTGTLSEAHFSKLSKLKILHLSSNSFALNVSSDWIPAFQVRNLDMGSCLLGPSFPSWLKSQKEVMYLDFSNASILGLIPTWFWEISSNLSLLNVSFNQLQGHLPNPLKVAPFADIDFSSNLLEGPIPLPDFEIALLDLSNNSFSGFIPEKIGDNMPNLIFLLLSGNQITGKIPESIGEMQLLQVIDLSENNLTGTIPSTMGNCPLLKALDLGHNNLVGKIPGSFCQLNQLQTLHLRSNKLTGELTSCFFNISSLETLDLGRNRLAGMIPPWIGNGFPNLRILSLRSNAFSGELPSTLSKLSSLQVLDLADNKFNGSIPSSFGSFKAMIQLQNRNQYLYYGKYRGVYYEETLILTAKAQSLTYTKTLSLVTTIDLSVNELSGDFPEELTILAGLLVLNLSRNHIIGRIPMNISSMHQLTSLDLSNNRLSGPIPPTMSALTFLGYLNLSNNNFSGTIPYADHMTTFDASSFGGNIGLCGPPLSVKCQDSNNKGTDRRGIGDEESSNELLDKWFYMCVGLGFAAGLLVPFLILAILKSWGSAYFSLVDTFVDKLNWSRESRAIGRKKRSRSRH